MYFMTVFAGVLAHWRGITPKNVIKVLLTDKNVIIILDTRQEKVDIR